MQLHRPSTLALRAAMTAALTSTLGLAVAAVWHELAGAHDGWAWAGATLICCAAWLIATLVLWRRRARSPMDARDAAGQGLLNQAEAQARQGEPWFHLLFDVNPQPMFVYDTESLRYLAVNQAAIAAYGYSREEFLAMTIADIRAPAELPRLRDALAQAGPQGERQARHAGVWAHRRKDGSTLQVDLVASDVVLDGRPARLLLARDVTDQIAIAQQLQDVPRQLRLLEQETGRRLARRVHDDIGQALAMVQLQLGACIDSLRQGALHPLATQLQQSVLQIEEAARSAREILMDLRPAPLEAQGLVAALQARADAMRTVLDKDRLQLEMAEGLAQQRWPLGVERVALDIAKEATTNAVRHGQPRQVLIRLQGGPAWLRLSVCDDGIGIAAQHVHGRADRLGISGMHELAATIGARLTIAPRRPRGTEVTLHWPEPAHGQALHH